MSLTILIWHWMSMTIIVIVTKNVIDNSSNIVQIYFHRVFVLFCPRQFLSFWQNNVNDNSCHLKNCFMKKNFTESFFDCLFQLEFWNRNNIICRKNCSFMHKKLTILSISTVFKFKFVKCTSNLGVTFWVPNDTVWS